MICLLFLMLVYSIYSRFICGSLACEHYVREGGIKVNCSGLMTYLEYDCLTISFSKKFSGFCKEEDNGCDVYSPYDNEMIVFCHCTPGRCANYVSLTFNMFDTNNMPIYNCHTGTKVENCILPSMLEKYKNL